MKIHISGIYGSGKSTLAKILSNRFNIPIYALDEIKYKIKYSETRSVGERLSEVKKISKRENWITEGTWSDYANELFSNADFIILMNIPRLTCCYRILKRHFKRKKEKKDTLLEALKLSREVFLYHSKDRPISLKAHYRLIRKNKKKMFLVRNNLDIKKFLKFLEKNYSKTKD